MAGKRVTFIGGKSLDDPRERARWRASPAGKKAARQARASRGKARRGGRSAAGGGASGG
jgi:hypothetical protein